MSTTRSRLLAITTDITSRKCFATGCEAILAQETSGLKWKRGGPLKILFFSPQCPVWRNPPVFVRKWWVVSSLFSPYGRLCSVSFSARAFRLEWSETRHSCGETTWAFSRAHRRACAIAEWLSRRVHEIRY